jgi:hypothetical protein
VGAEGASFFKRFNCFAMMTMIKARMKKLIATVMKLPHAKSGTPDFPRQRSANVARLQ